ncbi:MAG: class D sortase [Gammaproteobacteria bacterium]|nr:class D sortase [Gammaproteobacteria bacterium]MDE2346813.1 class D sortase [Gammaproteobacteria bacterium]
MYLAARVQGELQRRQAISAFMAAASAHNFNAGITYENTQNLSQTPLGFGAPNESHWSQGRIRAYRTATAAASPDSGGPIAILQIRRLGLEVPVYAQLNEVNLNRGAALIAGTAPPDSDGNTAIAAHRDGYFRVLKNLVTGDLIQVQTFTRVRTYRVTNLEIVKPDNVSVLRGTPDSEVTLVTCYPFYFVGSAPLRYIVRAVAVNQS